MFARRLETLIMTFVIVPIRFKDQLYLKYIHKSNTYTFVNSTVSRTTAMITLVISLVSFGLIACTGYLGGQIIYTEINAAIPIEQNNGEKDHDD